MLRVSRYFYHIYIQIKLRQVILNEQGMDTPGITKCTLANSGHYVCNNEVEDEQYPSYSTGNGHDVIWEGIT